MCDGMVEAGIRSRYTYKEEIKICWDWERSIARIWVVTQNIGYWSEKRGDIIRTMIVIGFPTFCFLIQFSHADFIDAVMISMAILFSVISGTIVPVEAILMGRLFNIFISYNTADQLHQVLVSINGNNTCTTNTAQQILNGLANSSDEIFCDATRQGNVISSASRFACDPDTTLTEEATVFSLYFVYLGIGTFVFMFLTNTLWNISALRQSKRLRIAYYKAVLHHSISWFETNDVSTLGPDFLKYVHFTAPAR